MYLRFFSIKPSCYTVHVSILLEAFYTSHSKKNLPYVYSSDVPKYDHIFR